ncbi:YopJ family acetyltransferase [Serratia symbiotica]|uniref:Uncharacterized protein n=2 Tax=Serratia symbiotica TaxID=138074 RepID=A0A068Z2E2_9GAMM|nr:YopJ family acetyltransferase [Serratia symbiotica]QLH64133.1 hypothetical protein SYMBAF_16000 [Serratia symbiotica]CDS56372.1 conserved hypothetical protein [Serratia symbiotica]
MEKRLGKNTITPYDYAFGMNEVCTALQKIKNHTVYEKISKVLGEHSVEYALLHTTKLLKENTQSNIVSNIFDTLTLPVICKSESNNIGNRIVNFSCLNSLFTYVNKSRDGNFKAITKMAKNDSINRMHYTCIDVFKKGSKIDLVVYESACLQGIASAGPDYGVKYLRNVLKDQFTKGKIKPENIRVGVIEMGIQNSPSDCAIFSVSTAKNLYKNTETSELMFSKLNNRGEKFTLFYNSSAKNTIIDPKSVKQCIDLHPLFLKHATSKSGIMLTNAKDKKINKKGETLQQRIVGNYQLRDGLIYSNSIEVKREIYLHRINERNS